MLRKKKGDVEWLEFEQLQSFPELVHGVFLKQMKHEEVGAFLHLPRVQSAKQVHGARVVLATDVQEECDGLATSDGDFGLLIKHADCQAAIFYDPAKRAIANIHCGWRGNVQNIYQKTVDFFVQQFGSHVDDLRVCISPSLGPDHAEFVNHRVELPEQFLQFQIRDNYFDLWEIARTQLMQAGVQNAHIEIAKICTFSQQMDFFSYRRDKKTGRHGTIVALKP